MAPRLAKVPRSDVDGGGGARELADGYGELGMLLQAAGFLDAAEPAYRNAQALVPDDLRWPYYLAHIHHDRSSLERAERASLQVLALTRTISPH